MPRTPEEIAARAAAVKARRQAAREAARDGRVRPERLVPDRAARRAARLGRRTRMDGYRTAAGNPLAGDDTLVLSPGQAATPAPETIPGIVQPAVAVEPGQSAVAAATITGGRGYVGLQWVAEDGTPGDILWEAGRGRVTVTGTAPPNTAGARPVLVGDPGKPGDWPDQQTRAVMQSLRAWRRSRGEDDA